MYPKLALFCRKRSRPLQSVRVDVHAHNYSSYNSSYDANADAFIVTAIAAIAPTVNNPHRRRPFPPQTC